MASDKKQDLAATEENTRLQRQVVRLHREKATLEALLADQSPSSVIEISRDLMKRLAEIEDRVTELERENRDFANMYVQAQEQVESLTNLYITSQRLYATLDPDEVMHIIKEILIEMVGAEEFGILLLDEEKKTLRLVAEEGARKHLPTQCLPAGEGIIGDVAASRQPFYFEPTNALAQEAHLPMAVIPLNIRSNCVGAAVIYKLFSQKTGFSPIDHQILEVVAAHAATALMSARLHKTMNRKLKTIEGFIELMKPSMQEAGL